MNSEVQDTGPTIECLPDEIISIILQNNDCRDVINFASTCKRFNSFVKVDQTLWKHKFRDVIPAEIVKILEDDPDSNWLAELKTYFILRNQIHTEVLSMSPKYYWNENPNKISLEDVRYFFDLALSHQFSYYYTISILQDIVYFGYKQLDERKFNTPYTLTEIHYAKVALRHIVHTFLAVKWVRLHIFNELTPLAVINFFLQWIDTDRMYCDDKLQVLLNKYKKKVEARLDATFPPKTKESVHDRMAKGTIKERDVLAAITHVLYNQPHLAIIANANVDLLSPFMIQTTRCANPTTIAAMYVYIAKAYGLDCELVVFPNHLFVEWREKNGFTPKLYTLNLESGEVRPKRQCPFSQGNSSRTYNYNPDSLLQYLYSEFQRTTGSIRNWYTENSTHLLNFLGTDDNEHNPYRNFLPYLLTQIHEQVHIKLMNLTTRQMHLIHTLSNLNPRLEYEPRPKTINKRVSGLKYAVGMICRNTKLGYICLITRWYAVCPPNWTNRPETGQLEFGTNQPFYYVLAADQSERYVAQENLTFVPKTNRFFHLEHMIAFEFAYFDGFSYVPNKEKQIEYPDDQPVVEQYKANSHDGNGSRDNHTTVQGIVSLNCRTIRIGSYRYTPKEKAILHCGTASIIVPNSGLVMHGVLLSPMGGSAKYQLAALDSIEKRARRLIGDSTLTDDAKLQSLEHRRKVYISSRGVKIIAPSLKNESRDVVLQIPLREVIKILVHFGKGLPVIFVYTKNKCGADIRKSLDMTEESVPYYNPISKNDVFRKITLLPELITDEAKTTMKCLFGKQMDELTPRETNDILVRTCPKNIFFN